MAHLAQGELSTELITTFLWGGMDRLSPIHSPWPALHPPYKVSLSLRRQAPPHRPLHTPAGMGCSLLPPGAGSPGPGPGHAQACVARSFPASPPCAPTAFRRKSEHSAVAIRVARALSVPLHPHRGFPQPCRPGGSLTSAPGACPHVPCEHVDTCPPLPGEPHPSCSCLALGCWPSWGTCPLPTCSWTRLTGGVRARLCTGTWGKCGTPGCHWAELPPGPRETRCDTAVVRCPDRPWSHRAAAVPAVPGPDRGLPCGGARMGQPGCAVGDHTASDGRGARTLSKAYRPL